MFVHEYLEASAEGRRLILYVEDDVDLGTQIMLLELLFRHNDLFGGQEKHDYGHLTNLYDIRDVLW